MLHGSSLGAQMEIYVSTDIEADGPIPGVNSMLSLGSAAFMIDDQRQGRLVDTFEINLTCAEGAVEDAKTALWWQSQPEAWQYCRSHLVEPKMAMQKYVAWLGALPGKPIFVGYPVSYDFMFVYWYLMRYVGRSPFSHSALDIKTLAMAALKMPYNQSTKRNMPKRWFNPVKHSHKALDDALEQGYLFCEIYKDVM